MKIIEEINKKHQKISKKTGLYKYRGFIRIYLTIHISIQQEDI